MKSFTTKALAVAAASVCGSAIAGSASTPAVKTFATEALTASTAVTLGQINYKLGVSRTAAQDFTIVIKPKNSGTTFDSTTCSTILPDPGPGTAAGNDFTVSLKRSGTGECAYEVDITNATAGSGVGLNISFKSGLKLTAHGLASGSTEDLAFAIKDLGETAYIDNSNDVFVTVANSALAVTMVNTTDTATVATVNDAAGPLYGFATTAAVLASTGDSDANAAAAFQFNINPTGTLVIADGTTAFANAHIASIAVTISDSAGFDGMATNGFTVTAVPSGAAVPTVTSTASSAKFSLAPGHMNATGLQTVSVKFLSAKNKSLGTQRTFGASLEVDPTVGANSTISDADFWTWSADAIELRSAFLNNDDSTGNFTRFFFQNTGSTAVGVTAACQAENGVTATVTLAAGSKLNPGTTVFNAKDVCTFSTGKRGSVTFTISAPARNIKGVFQQAVNGVSGGYIPLERPYANGTY